MLPRKMFLDDMFDNFLESETSKMKCDIYENDGAYNLELDMPGYTKSDINIEYNKGTLTISAEKKHSEEDKDNKKYIRRERFYGKLSRSFYLGDIDEESIKAEFKDGTLKVVAPKKDENISKKVINID
ncbi:MAG: Hsp20/alpha crystallin family protein [Bacilli bacterium]|nr:Hsp20/alpha crystallin family protein [Bacilli bacterium]